MAGLKHLFKMPREENTNTELVTIELDVAMEMSQHELTKRDMTYKLEMTVLCSCLGLKGNSFHILDEIVLLVTLM